MLLETEQSWTAHVNDRSPQYLADSVIVCPT
ncbi:hypothetical protein [Enterococcus phage vB_Efm8_KEN21]